MLPFAIATLFGNLDAWYPLAYGALLLATLASPSRGTVIAAGIAVAVVSVAKLHPASLLLWIAARAWVAGGGPQARVLAAAAATVVAIVLASLLVGGLQPWQDYVAVVRAGTGAELVDARNLGPVSLLGQATALGAGALQAAQAVVTLLVIVVSVVAAMRIRDPLTSLAIAMSASLVTLPVTWYHYPVALMPVAIALAIRHPASRPRVVLAVVVVDLAIAIPALAWLAVAILLVAAIEAARRGTESAKPLSAGHPA